jgi:cytochrome c oxidase subunit III
MSTPRTVIDASELPEVVFGSKDLAFWGTVGFMVIEGTTLAILVSCYLYLWQNFERWPPASTALPDLVLPTVSMLFLVASNLPAWWLRKACQAKDLPATKRWLVVCTLVSMGWIAFRLLEFRAVNTRWDDDAYGSAVWALLFAHFTLLAVEMAETLLFALIFVTRNAEEKHFPDVEDDTMYWFFVTLVWVPIWFVVYVLPRMI